ncbi:glycosyltransferase family 2 protein [Aliarcobacter butzleri]|uniref:glycosyltransferase family 2 protein n=1 Tax=Aliarcobacter butzleri TaxID=28197 RepID=UPI001EDC1F90|nr:glycosyltransferase family 2 protein [Aliarcobacter butzleri]MCG3707682.1 glycosyltransferase family 2 protein [Aliarcobacter butzleri]
MKFSIITPTYNRAHTIERAIKSMKEQTYENWEMIISDDGSTDNTEELLKKYLREDSRIKYIKAEKNGGVGKARNIGFQNISDNTDWIGFLDSDDIFVDNALELMKKKIEEFPDIKQFAFSTRFQDGRFGSTIKYDNFLGDYNTVLGQNNDVSGEFNVLLNKSIIDNGFHFEESVNGYEWIAWLRLSKKGIYILYTNTVTRIYITEGESLIRNKSKNLEYYKNSHKALTILLTEFGDDLKKANQKTYSKYISWYGLASIKLGRRYEGLKFTVYSIMTNPFEIRNLRNIAVYLGLIK